MRLPGLIYDSPHPFSAKQRAALAILPPTVAFGLRGLLGTCRIDMRNEAVLEQTLADHGHAILAFWHECMGFAIYHYRNRNYHTTTSYSYDGELAARVVHHFGCEAVRGSSSRGGSEALAEMEKAIRAIPCVGITPDGPRGPRRVAKPGAAILAGRTQTPILPVAFAIDRTWRLNSWDRFPVPKPGARLIAQYGEVVAPPPNDSPEAVEVTRVEMERNLNAVHEYLSGRIST